MNISVSRPVALIALSLAGALGMSAVLVVRALDQQSPVPAAGSSAQPFSAYDACSATASSGIWDTLAADTRVDRWDSPAWDAKLAADLRSFAALLGGSAASAPFGPLAQDSGNLAFDLEAMVRQGDGDAQLMAAQYYADRVMAAAPGVQKLCLGILSSPLQSA